MRFKFATAVVAIIGTVIASLSLASPAWAAGNYALNFTGPGVGGQNYVTTATSPTITKDFTLSVDVRWDGTLGYILAASRPFSDAPNTSGSMTGICIGLADGKPVLGLKAGGGGENRTVVGATALTAGRWYTLTATYAGTTLKVFIDGVENGSGTYATDLDLSLGQTKWVFGREFANSTNPDLKVRGFHGDVDNFVISSGLYPAALTTLAQYTFSEGSGATTADSTAGGRTGVFSASNPPTWVQGSDAVGLNYVSTEPGVTPVTRNLRPYTPYALAPSSTFTRPGYRLSKWTTGVSSPQLNTGSAATMPLSALTYYPVWAPTTQTITYQPGLGTGANVTRTAATGTTVTVGQYSALGFTRAGYRQSGWTSSSVNYAQSARLTMGPTNLVFVAAWTPENQTVSYGANGGTGTPPTQAAVPTGSSISVASSSSISRAGYRFTGWTDGGVINYQPGDTYAVSARSIQFTAQWQAIPQTVTYVSGSGASGAVPPSSTVPTDDTFTVAAQGDLVRAGYTFAGWRDQRDDLYSENANYTVSASAVTLTAVWTPLMHTVTYVNADDSAGTPPTEAAVATDDTFTVASGAALSRSGYVFSGWTDGGQDAFGNPTVYQPGEPYRLGIDDVQLAPMWTALPHSVSYRFAGGESGTPPDSRTSVTDAAFVVSTDSGFSRAGYTFAGWRDSTGLYPTGASYTTGTADVVLVAEWTANPHSVTYVGGTGGGGTLPTQADVVTADSFTVANADLVTRAGYTFAGWKSSTTEGTYQPEESYRMGVADVTLTAQWIANTYNVRYYLTNAATGTVPPATTATTESTITTAAGSGFALPGYTLQGWFDGATTTAVNSDYVQGIGDTDFVTRWQAQAHAVTYLAGGATGTVPTQADVETDAGFTLASASALDRAGYSFAGWGAHSTLYPEGFSYTADPADMVFTANWAPNAHHIVFVAGRGATGAVPEARDLFTGDAFLVGTPDLTLTGYHFDGWVDCTDAPPSTEVRGVGDLISATGSTPDLVFYCAHWTAETHAVTYAANGADGALPTQADAATDATLTIASADTLTREGNTFGGWTDGMSTYQAGDAYLVAATNVTLTAVWNPVYLNVVYLVGGGASGLPPEHAPVAYGTRLVVAAADELTLDAQYFWGWSDGARTYQPADAISAVTTDIALTATWGDHPLAETPSEGSAELASTGVDSSSLWFAGLAGLTLLLGGSLWLFRMRRRRA
jgi:uncharacterized repeat protein (TIGR02543 family)/LPXTG-motif cell wall-anchored protein